jgi:Rieske Fe-S protein
MPDTAIPTGPALTRRAVVAGACGAACAAALTACSGYGAGRPPAPAPAPASPAPPASAGDPAAPGALTATSAVPVGGGVVFGDQDVVVTQPVAGEFKAFTATCTHQGCLVGEVSDGTINCPCHGSRYDVTDGSVVDGPASRPLAEKPITVQSGSILLA